MTNFLQPHRKFDPSVTEIMDRPQPVSDDLKIDLETLAKLNRYFGSYDLIRHFLQRWIARGESVSVLDLCTASGDIPRYVADWSRAQRSRVRIHAIDFRPSTLSIAKAKSIGYPEITYEAADVLSFMPAQRFDIVICSLALHHFALPDALNLLRRIRSFACRGVVVADLARSDFGILGIHLLTNLLVRNSMNKFDARLSMQRAFSFRELAGAAIAAGWSGFGHRRFPVSRQAIWLEREALAPR
ncbi:MAG TPA: methyltransferase domain-containing protein [Chthoniobacterales bacterium]|nr:methyltransferase domain-containing protein [Chthoniobacterales bacterium]